MRNFIISLICLLILIFTWIGFSFYSSNAIAMIQEQTDVLISDSIRAADWTSAETEYGKLCSMWNQYKKAGSIFLDTRDINEIDSVLEKAYFYMKAHDISNSSGEFSYLKDKFGFIHQNETITFSNIF